METINGEWYMQGCDRNDPNCLHTPEELIALVKRAGFLALFAGDAPGFSVEERTPPEAWWTGDPASDPWEWRKLAAADPEIAYGKFFGKKAGFVSKAWFPALANLGRNGYDFDALYDDGFATHRAKKLMDALEPDDEARGLVLMTRDLKEKAGFGRGGEKNFEGVLTDLQMKSYLIMSDFRQRVNRQGEPYGWHIAAIGTPETKWGYAHIAAGYAEKPAESGARLTAHLTAAFPGVDEQAARRLIGVK